MKHYLILPLLILAHSQTWAAPAPLGRLFLTPQQRAALDHQRLHNPSGINNEPSQTLNGIVHRSDGRSTRWVNGEVHWNDARNAPSVPVGDTFNPATGERKHLLGEGKIITKSTTGAR